METKERWETHTDSFTLGTAGKNGAVKVYFDVNDFKGAEQRIAKGVLLYRKFVEQIQSTEQLKDIIEGA